MTDIRPLDGRVAVVTGAGRGLGAALARRLAGHGMRVALLGRDRQALAAVAQGLPAASSVHEVDVTDDAAMERTAREVERALGPPSVVVANAGVAEGGPFAASDPATWRRVIEVNLIGSAITARAFLPGLTRTRGYFLQIASTAAFGAAPMMSAYCASKAGAEAFARSLRAEQTPHGVAVGVAYLSWTDTGMIKDVDRLPVLRELRAHMPRPARRIYPVDQVASWLARGVENRSAAVYAPPWLRLGQVARPFFPAAVTLMSRRKLPGLAARTPFEPTGLLGRGGQVEEEHLARARQGPHA
ncbi:SDR family oxidoreductase [Streptomyces globisporus]|uniref:SDR family oxidoreductase n=1 Tax=Streptomyces globisporus TaxID=1908 RepID=UPI0005686DEB|nr:SDR family oxidoreductase [Streptomyces globisporus]